MLGHVRWARELEVTPFMLWLDHGMQPRLPQPRRHARGGGAAMAPTSRSEADDRAGGRVRRGATALPDDHLDFGYRAEKLGFRLLYNWRAVVEHLRGMDLDFWRTKMRRLAVAERAFVRTHPKVPPYFYRRFSHAAPAAAGPRPQRTPAAPRPSPASLARSAILDERRPLLPSGACARLPLGLGGRRRCAALPYIRSGALTPSRPRVRAMTRLAATQSARRACSMPSGAPTTWQSR